VPGGGVALLRASQGARQAEADNDDQKTGIDIVRKALQAPLRQIAENAGVDGSVVVGKILENKTSTTTASTPRPASSSTW
jgi:chaperonin GroEL